MAATKVVYYQDADGTVPLNEWFEKLSPKVIQKCHAKLGRLEQMGHELRPEADYLRDEIYELRSSYQGVHYRMLAKERAVPPREIDLAVRRKAIFEEDPEQHRFKP